MREILSYAKYGEAAANGEDTEQLYKLTWNFPDSKEYNGEFAAEMKQAETDMEVKYEKYEKEQEKKEREEAKKGRPYKGMSEKYINITLLGHYDKKREEHYWRNAPGKRVQELQYRYIWYDNNGTPAWDAICRHGQVSSVTEFVSSSSFSKRNSPNTHSSNGMSSKDMYDVYDYDDPEDFYYDHQDEFDDIQDAEDYWEEAQ